VTSTRAFPPRIYVDTSVIGGCLDEEFTVESRALLNLASRGGAVLLVSDLMLEELAPAPLAVRQVLTALPPECAEQVVRSSSSRDLQRAYLAARVVGPARSIDAHHVAIATLARGDVIASWNFKHIVHWDKIRGFNAVNIRLGLPAIDIRSPREIV